MSRETDDKGTKDMRFPEISNASLQIAARVSAAVKRDTFERRPAPKIGLETVIDANGNGSYFLPDPEATNRFADLISRMAKGLSKKDSS